MKKVFGILLVVVFQFSALSSQLSIVSAESLWPDLSDSHPYKAALESLQENGVIRGYPDGTIKPDQPMNRVEGLKLIVQALNAKLSRYTTYEDLKFSDITAEEDAEKWYIPYISFAVSSGYMKGFDDGTFRKNATMTRAEFLKTLMKAKLLNPANDHRQVYLDVPRTHWISPFVNYLEEKGMMPEELMNRYFKPDEPITRGLAAYFTNALFYEDRELSTVDREPPEDQIQDIEAESENTDHETRNTTDDLQSYLRERDLHEGIASYYGDAFNGRGTASGEKFDNSLLTAAQPYLPFGSIIRVTNTANDKSVEVKVNDCGPFAKGRVIDLSKAAFESIGSLSAGLLKVKVEVVSILEANAFRDRCYDIAKSRW